MARHFGILMTAILDCLDLDIPVLPLEDVYHFAERKRVRDLSEKMYAQTIWRMKHKGYLKVVEKNNRKFLQITKKGQLAKLFEKAKVDKTEKWDGMWRVVVFDIPENFRHKRDNFRWLLKSNSFKKLQASVFVSPYSFNREAITYLEETGLKDFVRVMKVEEMDNDFDLKKKFDLLNSRPRI